MILIIDFVVISCASHGDHENFLFAFISLSPSSPSPSVVLSFTMSSFSSILFGLLSLFISLPLFILASVFFSILLPVHSFLVHLLKVELIIYSLLPLLYLTFPKYYFIFKEITINVFNVLLYYMDM